MKRFLKYVSILLAVPLLILLFLRMNNDLGIPKEQILADALESHAIDSSWLHTPVSTTDRMAAMLFYSPDKDDFTFSIYVNRPGFSFGYFFRGGGTIVEVQDYVAEFMVEGYTARAYVSMNAQGICSAEYSSSKGRELMKIDPTEPFALVFDGNQDVKFFDASGTLIEAFPHKL